MPREQSYRNLIAGVGYVGFRVARQWHSDGYDVHAITRSSERAELFRSYNLRPIVLDLARPATPYAVLPHADVVLWAVGYDRVAGVARDQVWLTGLARLLDNLPSAPQRFIYVSSTSVYGNGEGETVDETSPTAPVSEGGQCCMRAERLLREKFNVLYPRTHVVVLRMAGIYGPDRLLRRVADLKNRKALPGDPDSWLNLIHVDDAVRMIQHAATASSIPNTINVVNSGTISRRQYYSHLSKLVGAPPPVFDSTASGSRIRGGNKRVVSAYCETPHLPDYLFNNVLEGIENAVEKTVAI